MSQDAMKEILTHILERVDSIDEKLESMAGVAAQASEGNSRGPTRRYKNEAGDWVYDTSGLNEMTDRDTGEKGYWATTKGGKSIPVSEAGYPLWLGPQDRPDHPSNK